MGASSSTKPVDSPRRLDPTAFWIAGITGAVSTLYFAFVAWAAPMTGDDWGIHPGDVWNTWTKAYRTVNGRYLGNLLAMLPTTGHAWKVAIVSATLAATWFVCSRSARHRFGPILALAALVAVPLGIFREAQAWWSGFANFAVPPLVLAVFLLWVRRRLLDEPSPRDSRGEGFAGAALGLLAQGFAEHTSLGALALSVAVIVVLRRRLGRFPKRAIGFAVGSLAGCIAMFLSPTYRNGTGRAASLFAMPLSERLASNLSSGSFPGSLLAFVVPELLLSLALLILAVRTTGPRLGVWSAVRILVWVFVPVYGLVGAVVPTMRASGWFESGMCALYLTASASGANDLIPAASRSIRPYFGLLFAAFLSCGLPLLFVDGGFRCDYVLYVLELLAALELWNPIWGEGRYATALGATGGLVLAVSIGIHTLALLGNSATVQVRETLLREGIANGKTPIVLPALPWPNYVHQQGDPNDAYHLRVFRTFYGIPDGTQVIIEP